MTGFEYLFQQLVNALSVGSLYALIAVGLSLIFGILRLSNFAHGDMMMIGAFATVLLTTSGLSFLLACLLGIAVAALAGVIIERVAYRPVRGAPDVTMLLTSLALTFILENLGILLFTASPRNFPLPDWMTKLWSLFDGRVTFTNINVLSVGLTLVSLLFLTWFMRRTTVGLGMRAAAEDLGAAQLVGVRVNRVIVVAFMLASAFAGLAGVLWAAQAGVVDPLMGFTPLLKAFVAAIIGGLGSLPGAVLGGYLLGALEVLIVAFLPPEVSPYRDAIVFGLLIGFLLLRPGGLLNVTREVKL
ncbi:branched-chain amino acid ABC transporter permease (plasmid) [Deinococcus psychrotolerans]|uniref:Branched-chain amino acid ABC transporter permease n=1 Tax=Deinococcus psychrotolerans TaxID=2489213 RepID=A0A3G8YKT3_9DEIO|nr:branched-chain amino acid ABC transporter permease [Deinococcus psychrotolerans]AZI44897.1 branched-chain amino acid ABC transporter permease [Deinococcus psychrotolerans]